MSQDAPKRNLSPSPNNLAHRNSPDRYQERLRENKDAIDDVKERAAEAEQRLKTHIDTLDSDDPQRKVFEDQVAKIKKAEEKVGNYATKRSIRKFHSKLDDAIPVPAPEPTEESPAGPKEEPAKTPADEESKLDQELTDADRAMFDAAAAQTTAESGNDAYARAKAQAQQRREAARQADIQAQQKAAEEQQKLEEQGFHMADSIDRMLDNEMQYTDEDNTQLQGSNLMGLAFKSEKIELQKGRDNRVEMIMGQIKKLREMAQSNPKLAERTNELIERFSKVQGGRKLHEVDVSTAYFNGDQEVRDADKVELVVGYGKGIAKGVGAVAKGVVYDIPKAALYDIPKAFGEKMESLVENPEEREKFVNSILNGIKKAPSIDYNDINKALRDKHSELNQRIVEFAKTATPEELAEGVGKIAGEYVVVPGGAAIAAKAYKGYKAARAVGGVIDDIPTVRPAVPAGKTPRALPKGPEPMPVARQLPGEVGGPSSAAKQLPGKTPKQLPKSAASPKPKVKIPKDPEGVGKLLADGVKRLDDINPQALAKVYDNVALKSGMTSIQRAEVLENARKLMGLPQKFTQAQLKERYLHFANQYHPDKLVGMSDQARHTGEIAFKIVNEAKGTLASAAKKAA